MAAAGTLTVTRGTSNPTDRAPVRSIIFTWTSDASGNVSGQALYPLTSVAGLNGVVREAVTIPNGGGTAPSDNYDATILDENGRDILAGLGADRDTATVERVTPATALDGAHLDFRIANAGASKGGKLILYLWCLLLLTCGVSYAADITLDPKPDAQGIIADDQLITLHAETQSAAGYVWNVIGPSGFVKIRVDRGDQAYAYLAVPKGGPYSVMLTVVTQDAGGKVGVDQGQHQFWVGEAKPGPPIPKPDEPPIDDVTPAPVPADGMRVLIVEEASDRPRLPSAQMNAYTGAKLKQHLDASCVKDAKGQADWRIIDDDFVGEEITVLPPHWHAAYKDAVTYAHSLQKLPSGAQPPVIIVSNRGVTSLKPPGELTALPQTLPAMQQLIDKYKVK